jgi:hypothetical protein
MVSNTTLHVCGLWMRRFSTEIICLPARIGGPEREIWQPWAIYQLNVIGGIWLAEARTPAPPPPPRDGLGGGGGSSVVLQPLCNIQQ